MGFELPARVSYTAPYTALQRFRFHKACIWIQHYASELNLNLNRSRLVFSPIGNMYNSIKILKQKYFQNRLTKLCQSIMVILSELHRSNQLSFIQTVLSNSHGRIKHSFTHVQNMIMMRSTSTDPHEF